jgi:hypothetical protein
MLGEITGCEGEGQRIDKRKVGTFLVTAYPVLFLHRRVRDGPELHIIIYN